LCYAVAFYVQGLPRKNATILITVIMLIIIKILMTAFSSKMGAPLHFHTEVLEVLNRVLHMRWIGRHGPNDNLLPWWPPRSPDLTLCIDTLYVPQLPRNLRELQNRIVAALEGVTTDMLQRVWQEIDYPLDVCRVARECMKLGEFLCALKYIKSFSGNNP
jgi:hypothetical protein